MSATAKKPASKANRNPTMQQAMDVALRESGVDPEGMIAIGREAFGWYAGALCLGGYQIRDGGLRCLKAIAELDKTLSDLLAADGGEVGPNCAAVARKALDGVFAHAEIADHYGGLSRATASDIAAISKKVEKRLAQFMKKYPAIAAAPDVKLDLADPKDRALAKPEDE